MCIHIHTYTHMCMYVYVYIYTPLSCWERPFKLFAICVDRID